MPLYEYECDACGHRFEVIQKFSDPPLETCPKCGGSVHKLISSPAFQFKGTGWYITDYKNAGAAKGDKTKSGDGDKTESKPAETKTDSKASEAKGESKLTEVKTAATETSKKSD